VVAAAIIVVELSRRWRCWCGWSESFKLIMMMIFVTVLFVIDAFLHHMTFPKNALRVDLNFAYM
jgi:hypothetical protein